MSSAASQSLAAEGGSPEEQTRSQRTASRRDVVDVPSYALRANLDAAPSTFVVFSSLSPLLGLSRQWNYAAANAYLDAFVRWRASQGLPATELHVGNVTEVGLGALGNVGFDPQTWSMLYLHVLASPESPGPRIYSDPSFLRMPTALGGVNMPMLRVQTAALMMGFGFDEDDEDEEDGREPVVQGIRRGR
mmetsp:Transcript_15883/g.29021  ORF Transcript_15883/g.29021 Transcript_15883/m.29021 type:complete len:190 (-) Transcript_15883:114-683(-)